MEKTTDLPQTGKLYHIILYQIHLACAGFKLTSLGVIGTDCIGSYKSYYNTITATTVSSSLQIHILSQQTKHDLAKFVHSKNIFEKVYYVQQQTPIDVYHH